MFAVTIAVNSDLYYNLRNLSYIKMWVSYIINGGIITHESCYSAWFLFEVCLP